MQSEIDLETDYQGLTQEERRLLCQLFDEALAVEAVVQEPTVDPSSNKGGNK